MGVITYQYMSDKDYSVITINREEKRNAISLRMAEELMTAIEKAKKDSIKFLVITGAGDRMFCSGGDLNDLHGNLSVEEAERRLLTMMGVLHEIAVFPVPTIALLNGGAAGGGCELATACDIRIARRSTKFGFIQSSLGIMPGWGGGILLAKRVHTSFAFRWIMEGTVYQAEELEAKGWLHRLINNEDWQDKDEVLAPYIAKSFQQMKIFKSQYLEEIGVIGLKDRMMNEVKKCASLWETEEHRHAVEAFLNRD
ncbi:enoyl-CoA hydratase/isomerase family protein [Ornithinibacillus bavariensis]|uniref:Enoyl-CoA hydratase n=1 Tax=Ornithinibacillus bavariensis TaxID=545502 RepID=A0A920C6U8_9BACI|nr:enoyl-CoA hydratase/isomerase family protein [Ornithinibacillus bavariensis]GIO26052.1 enoyl-CoA hydratase [Ornithinibacillus bavariensis]